MQVVSVIKVRSVINIRKLNIIDENILFELDYDNHKITNTFIGNSRIVTIDNFFKNPSDVVDFAYKTPFSKSEQISAKFPGMRSKVWTDTAILNNFYQKILIDEFKETQYKPNITNINVNAIDSDFQGDFKNLDIKPSFHQHTDSLAWQRPFSFRKLFASTVWLNPTEQCSGGTAFWKNKVIDSQSFLSKKAIDKSWERLKSNPSFENEFINWETKWISHEYENQTDTHWYERLLHNYEKSKKIRENEKTWWTESNSDWELLDVTEMKYNRMVVYQGIYFHTSYMERDAFINYPRISFQIFF